MRPRRSRMLGALLVLLVSATLAGQDPRRNEDAVSCSVCHGSETGAFRASVHAQAGIECMTCHGGDPTVTTKAACVDNPSFRGIPSRKELVEHCGTCHSQIDRMLQYGLPTDQLALYRTSPHGKALLERDDPNVPTCADCHGFHDVRRAQDPESPTYPSRVPATCSRCHANPALMALYDLPADVYEKYAASVHGRGLLEGQQLRLPHCGSCHSSHAAKPAGVSEVSNVCGQCHVATRDYFRDSPHFAAAQRGQLEECTTCHGHHATPPVADPITEGWDSSTCRQCHEAGPDDRASETIAQMDRILNGLRLRVAEAAADIQHARGQGIVTAQEEGALNDARHVLIMAGPLSHTASADRLERLAEKGVGVVERVRESIENKLRRVRDRRILAGAIFAGLVLLVVALNLKLRSFHRSAVDGGEVEDEVNDKPE